jgi:hypothetical protein
MSELVNRIHDLSQRIIELEDDLIQEKRKYADEVDHSDNLSYLLGILHDGKNCSSTICSFCDAVRLHEKRRDDDMGLGYEEKN